MTPPSGTRRRPLHLAGAALVALTLLTGCTTPGSHRAPGTPPASPHAQPAALASTTPPTPTVTPLAGTLPEALVVPSGTHLLAAVQQTTTGDITGWSVALQVDPSATTDGPLGALGAQLTTHGWTVSSTPGHLGATTVDSTGGTAQLDAVALPAPDGAPDAIAVACVHEPKKQP